MLISISVGGMGECVCVYVCTWWPLVGVLHTVVDGEVKTARLYNVCSWSVCDSR